MAKLNITPLNKIQYLRLATVSPLDEEPIMVYFVEIVGTVLTKFSIKYDDNHNQDLFLSSDDVNFIMNGVLALGGY